MKQTRILMGMPITVEIVDETTPNTFNTVFDYLAEVDERFSTYKSTSEISRINRGELREKEYSKEMQTILQLSEETKKETQGYFDIFCNGTYDPSGIVKGWAINNAANLLKANGYSNYYIDAGGDIEISGYKQKGQEWKVGIRNPFNRREHVKVLALTDHGIATSGTAIRGQHIYNPHHLQHTITEIVSMTVIGPNVYDADRFATAAFAMGKKGINFIESLKAFEGYMIDKEGNATITSGFEQYVL